MSFFSRKGKDAAASAPLPQIVNEPTGPDIPRLISLAPPGTEPDKVTINLPGPSSQGMTPLDQRSYLVVDRGEGPRAFQVRVGLVSVSDPTYAAQALCDGFVMRQLAAHPVVAAEAGFSRIEWVFMPGEDGLGMPDPGMLELLKREDIEYQLYLAPGA
ncbi:MAG: hypothetical protein LBG11_03975 [Bifidobacteriaceae bacterium]|nr:hypothetical protein [Bifidobacteriaceae bacterium]